MLDLDGNISESNAHNFFLVLDGKLCTPSNKNVLGRHYQAGVVRTGGELGNRSGGR